MGVLAATSPSLEQHVFVVKHSMRTGMCGCAEQIIDTRDCPCLGAKSTRPNVAVFPKTNRRRMDRCCLLVFFAFNSLLVLSRE